MLFDRQYIKKHKLIKEMNRSGKNGPDINKKGKIKKKNLKNMSRTIF